MGLPASRSGALAKQAALDADGLPVRFDRLVDLLPRRLVCFRPESGPVELWREMRPDERGPLEARAAALDLALRPFREDQVTDVEASIGAMLAGFRSMRQQGEAVEDVVVITRAVLREFPAWAIAQGCLKIARHETRSDPRFAPNDAEIVEVVRNVVKPYREALDAATALLGAVVQSGETARGSTVRERPQPSPLLVGDGKHAHRVAAELAARKARRDSGAPA